MLPNCVRVRPALARGPFLTGRWRAWVAAACLLLGNHSSQAQWLTQTNVVKPGWSAVYFYVDASSQNLGQLITNNPANPIDQIWLWKYPASDAQYITDPLSPLSGGGQWAAWVRYPTNTPNTLAALIPNSAYLIHSTAAANYTWTVQGQPVPPSYNWDMTGLNFIGFPTPSANPPSFQNYLAQNPAISSVVQLYDYVGGPFSILNPQPVFSQYATPVTRGQAFWVSATNVNNSYFGPFKVNLPNPSGLNYGTAAGQFTLHLVNVTTNTITVSVRLLPSETPPYGQASIVGPPPLLVEGALDSSNLTYACTSLPVGSTDSWTLAPAGQSGADVAVVLGVNRFALTNSAGSLYAGFLQFSDSLGFSEVDVPVSANAANNAGLWLGTASISQVGSYLKSYATNVDGSLMLSQVTNSVYTTNYTAFVTTNLVISDNVTTNQTVNYYNLTNLVVNSYTTNRISAATNSFVLATNWIINTFDLTNLVITTSVTNYYYSGGSIVWQTATATNISETAYATTNFLIGTNALAVATTNNTPVAVTNMAINYVTITNLLTTNGIFLTPVTSQTVASQTLTNFWAGTNLSYNVLATNVLAITVATNLAAVTNYVATNINVTIISATNYVATNSALAVITNGASLIVVNPQINNYVVSNQLAVIYNTNYTVISNNFVLLAGATNFLGSTTNSVTVASITATNSLALRTNYAATILTITTNAAYLVTTNSQTTPSGNYVVTAINTNLGPVVTAYPLRLIVFNDGTNCSLLQRVYFGLGLGSNLVVTTTENALSVSNLNTARRITATHMPWTAANNPWPFTGQLAAGGLLSTTVTDAYDDQAANPFLHTYHPDHNNLTAISDPTVPPHELPEGSQSFGISRQITLNVLPNTTDFISLTTANSSLSGNYFETITLTGLGGATRSFSTAGNFKLTCISTIATLTTH